MPFAQGKTVAVDLFLDKIRFFRQYAQSAVNLVIFERRLFEQGFRKEAGGPFGIGFQDPSIKQAGQDRIEIVLEGMAFRDLFADQIEFQFMINFLKKQIADLILVLILLRQPLCGRKRQSDLLILLLFLFVEFPDMFFRSDIRILPVLFPNIMFVSQFFNGHRMLDALTVVVGLDHVEQTSVFRLSGSDSHFAPPVSDKYLYYTTRRKKTQVKRRKFDIKKWHFSMIASIFPIVRL